MQNFDPIAIIVFAVLFVKVIYPGLEKLRIPFPPVTRITFGYLIAGMAMGYAALLQHFIYKRMDPRLYVLLSKLCLAFPPYS